MVWWGEREERDGGRVTKMENWKSGHVIEVDMNGRVLVGNWLFLLMSDGSLCVGKGYRRQGVILGVGKTWIRIWKKGGGHFRLADLAHA